MQALGAEFGMLQGAGGATISESSSRSSLYMTTLFSSAVALALVAQASRFGEAFFIFALAVFPVVFFLGITTYYRLLETGVEDVIYARVLSAAATVAIVNSVVGGVFFALAVAYITTSAPWVSIGVGAAGALVLAVLFLTHQWRTWMRIAAALPMKT